MAEKSTSKYEDMLFINPDNITYGHVSFKGFDVKTVYFKGKIKGEFHIKPGGDVAMERLLSIVKKHVGADSEANLVDRSGMLSIDYPIYVIMNNTMLIDVVEDVWKMIEETLNEGA